MAMKETTRKVFEYLKANDGKDMTSADIAEALGMTIKSVDGSVTAGLQRKGLAYREPAEATLEDGTHKAVKLIRLTDEGRNFDPDAAEVAAE